ncbi:DNA excision repair protein ERCC-6-like 2 [Escovopsis weberi]|uniref:DNA excision repair protein ERCC-6-like 2 n=1 Tax=Escovopsis weberi TaxID=150374 RepID=A0A0M8N8R8_ESCWE|nr:DNA excision repair protein ERCC-6-like 2 [Escovopsis weberi]
MVEWDAVIADECHRLKDSYSQTTRAMMEVNALCRIGLTGTAIQNKYEELWTLLDWTNPGHFGSAGEWSNAITKPLTVGQSHDATKSQLSLARQTAKQLVQNLLPRYFLRRMKTLIAHQLPRKTDRVVFCPLTDVQRQAYLNFIESREVEILRTVSDICSYHRTAKGWCCNQFLPDQTRWQGIVFPSMIALQKLANHLTLLVPQTTEMDEKHQYALKTLKTCLPDTWKPLYKDRDRVSNLVNPEHCGKWKILRKLLKFWYGSGDKVLVFSHSVRLLRILQHLFTSTSYTVSYLDGSMGYEARQEVVDSFNSDPSRFVFLISTKAGGVGLNITSANKVVIVDPHWNPAYDLQAQDRAYRIGQTRDVEVFRLISVGTIEEIVYARQIYKQQQANIGYTASSERRYFRGVQQDTQRKGEIFGLSNIFTYHSDMGLLRDIVNRTNIAEAKAGVNLADVDMDRAASEEDALGPVKPEDAEEDGGLSQLASILTSKDQGEALLKSKKTKPQTNAVQAILRAAGVDYTHENSEVIGSSRVEEQLSKQAEMALQGEDGHLHGQTTLFRDSDDGGEQGLHGTYNPPDDVCLRQFCEMAREFGFGDATEFALIVEGWSQEERRNCLDTFYKRREALLDQEAEQEVGREIGVEVAGAARDGVQQDTESRDGSTISTMQSRMKMEDEKPPHSKDEDVKIGTTFHEGFKKEDEKIVHVDGSSKRTSIFLADSDDEDEL